jgi:hypothetical protein
MSTEEFVIMVVCATIGAIVIILFGVLLYRKMKSDKKIPSNPPNDETDIILASINDKEPRYDLIMKKYMKNPPSNCTDEMDLPELTKDSQSVLIKELRKNNNSYDIRNLSDIDAYGFSYSYIDGEFYLSQQKHELSGIEIMFSSFLLSNSEYLPLLITITDTDGKRTQIMYLIFNNVIKYRNTGSIESDLTKYYTYRPK